MSKTKRTTWKNIDTKLQQDITTGSGAMSVTFNPLDATEVQEIRVTLDSASATSENLVINVDHDAGSPYDVNILTQDMNTVADLRVCDCIRLFDGDKLTLAWTNTDSRTWGLEVIYKAFKGI